MTKLLVIDPGHGGKDPGAIGDGLHESVTVLLLSKMVKEYIENLYEGVRIVLTRSSDVYLTLDERTDLANGLKADYFLSLHNNGNIKKSAAGFESFIYDKTKDPKTVSFQDKVHDKVMEYLSLYSIRDRGKLKKNLHVCRETTMPALLLENLFITNISRETRLLRDKKFLEGLAHAIALGVGEGMNLSKKKVEVKTTIPKYDKNHLTYLTNLLCDGSTGQSAWAKKELLKIIS